MIGYPSRGRPFAPVRQAAPPVAVYGTTWCAASQQVRRMLDRAGIPYRYFDLEYTPGAEERVRWLTGGYASHPIVAIGGDVLIEPTPNELRWALADAGLLW